MGIAGQRGNTVEGMLDAAIVHGSTILSSITRAAVTRHLNGAPLAFTDAERKTLAETLAAVNATADLLGRALIRDYLRIMQERYGAERRESQITSLLREEVSHPLKPLPPEDALAYFLDLVPTLGVDPQIWGDDLRRHAFTLAVATEQETIIRVQTAIADTLSTGAVRAGKAAVAQIIEAAGVSPRNPQYAEMVLRTSVMDSYNQAADEERQDPDVIEAFPVWAYSNPSDGRSRPHHKDRDGKYYPASVTFREVRGLDIADAANCVLPGQTVQGRFLGGTRALYAGQAVEVVTRKGHKLAVTANHPVLSERGFVRAGHIKAGDYLACYGVGDNLSPAAKQVQKQPALIENVFCSFAVMAGGLFSKPHLPFDFHGDAAFFKGKVWVVRPDWKLPFKVQSRSLQYTSNSNLHRGNRQHPFVPGDSAAAFDREAILHTSAAGVSLLDSCKPVTRTGDLAPKQSIGVRRVSESDAALGQYAKDWRAAFYHEVVGEFVGTHAFHVEAANLVVVKVGSIAAAHFGPGSQLDASRGEPSGDGFTLDAEFPAKLLSMFPANVSLDEIVDVRRFHYEGPVFDMETDTGYFITENIIISNCRCVGIPVYVADWERLQAKGVRVETSW